MEEEILDSGNRIPLRTGICVLDNEGIRLENTKIVKPSTLRYRLIIYSLFVLFFTYRGMNMIEHGSLLAGSIAISLSVLYLYIIIISINFSTDTFIHWNDIKEIKFKKGLSFFSRPFVLIFFNKNNRLKKRILILPAVHKRGNEILSRAKIVFENYI